MRSWICLGCLSVVLAGCSVTKLMSRKQSWPVDDPAITAPGLYEPVSVTIDVHGVPHIRADNSHDGFYALGWMHARDRLFQMDTSRRVLTGRLGHLFGDRVADLDAFNAAMALQERARANVEAQGPDARDALTAYAEGVNASVAAMKKLPIEHRLLKADWEPWTPEDSLAIALLNSWALSSNISTEIATLRLRGKLTRDQLDLLFRADLATPPVDAHWDELADLELGAFTPEARAFVTGLSGISVGEQGASNNWVVSGSKSTDGQPIVANDPHLVQRVPSLWYVADVQAGDVHAAGGTFPGTPSILVGHNDGLAWGVTNLQADYVDVAIVKVDGDDLIIGGQKVPVTRRGRVATTPIGPLLTDLDAPYAAVLRWHAVTLEDHSADLFYGLNTAQTVDDALEALGHSGIVALNVVIADTDGSIAWQVAGTTPMRDGYTGRIPYPAWEAGRDWIGWVAGLPGERDPERGYVHTANARPDHDAADVIATSYVAPWRHDRIGQMLADGDEHSAEDLRQMQLDRLDLQAQAKLPPLLEGVTPSTDGARTCHDILSQWDFRAEADSAGPAVWAFTQREVNRLALQPLLGEDVDIYLRARGSSSGTLVDRGLESIVEDRTDVVDRALDRACAAMTERLGPEPAGWSWGALHHIKLQHPFSARSAALEKFGFNVSDDPIGGSPNTVNVGSYSQMADTWDSTFVPSIRLVMPTSDWEASTFSYPGGQSGHPDHPHYRDLFEPWHEGRGIPLYFSDEAVNAHVEQRIALSPG